MYTVSAQNPPRRKRELGWLKAFGIAVLAAAVMFLPFVLYDKGYFFFFGDFNVQQIPFYRMAHDAVRSGDIFWNSYTDLGANFIGSYSFYLLFSPFFWLTLPFPSEAVPYLMAPLLTLKIGCMALTSYLYIRRAFRCTTSFSTTFMRRWCFSRCCSSGWRSWCRTAGGACSPWR